MALVIALIVIHRFKTSITSFFQRMTEANIMGAQLKAAAIPQLQEQAPHAQIPPPAQGNAVIALPPELANDDLARRQLEYTRQNPVAVVIEYRRLFDQLKAERFYTWIFGTQIQLLAYLEQIEQRGDASARLGQLTQFYDQYVRLSGDANYPLTDYLGYLKRWEAVIEEGLENDRRYRLGTFGAYFLAYIRTNYPTNWAQRAG